MGFNSIMQLENYIMQRVAIMPSLCNTDNDPLDVRQFDIVLGQLLNTMLHGSDTIILVITYRFASHVGMDSI